MYFDDYGTKQATVMEMMGQKMRSIEVDGKNVMIDDAAKTAMSMPGMGPQMGSRCGIFASDGRKAEGKRASAGQRAPADA